jgi:hypothetical protein
MQPSAAPLGDDRVDPVEDHRPRRDPQRPHVVQHPGSADTAFGAIEDEDAVDIAPWVKLMLPGSTDPR